MNKQQIFHSDVFYTANIQTRLQTIDDKRQIVYTLQLTQTLGNMNLQVQD